MSNKIFSERLNKELDEIGVPPRLADRVDAFAILIKQPHYKAEAILNGNFIPDSAALNLMAELLEVNADWLLGKSDKRR